MADTFTIEGVTPRTRSVGGGIFKRVHEVTFSTLPSGLTGTIDVDDDAFVPERVRDLVTAAAARLEAVKAL